MILHHVHILFLNLASHDGQIACLTETDVVASMPVDHRLADHDLVPAIEKVLKNASWTYKDLTHIACVVGPGGFTSLRVAVSCANTLADQLGIPAAGIHLGDVLYDRVRVHSPDVFWFHSTRKDQLFVRGFGAHAGLFPEAELVTVEALAARLPAEASWIGEFIPAHIDAFASLKLKEANSRVSERLPAFLAAQSYEKRLLLPWYGRGW